MNETEIPADLMRPRQAAKLLQVHVSTIYRAMESGELPYWRGPGRNRRISRRDAVAMVQRGQPTVKGAATATGEPRKSVHEREQADRRTMESLKRHGLDKYL